MLRAVFDFLNEGPDGLMISDIVLCGFSFLVYLPLCFFVSRAFGWTTFGAHCQIIFFLRFANTFVIALAGGDDFKRRVLYWFFAFVTILKCVYLSCSVTWTYIYLAQDCSLFFHSCLTCHSIRFRFLITLLVLFTFSMFLLSAWWQVKILYP